MIVTYADALKRFRRGVYVHNDNWRAIVLCQNVAQLNEAWQEALNTLHAGKLSENMRVSYDNKYVELQNGGSIRFTVVNSLDDAQLHMDNTEFTHIIWIGDPNMQAIEFTESRKRSPVLAPEDLVTQIAGF